MRRICTNSTRSTIEKAKKVSKRQAPFTSSMENFTSTHILNYDDRESSKDVALLELADDSLMTSSASSDYYDLSNSQDIKRLELTCGIKYIHTNNINYQKWEKKLFIAPVSLIKTTGNDNKTMGVFAKEDLFFAAKKQVVLGVYLGKVSQLKSVNNDSVYVFETPDNKFIDGEKQCAWLAKVNTTLSKETANVLARWNKKQVEYYVDGGDNGVSILMGEQLLVYYGENFHHNSQNKEGLRYIRKTDSSDESLDIYRKYHLNYKSNPEKLSPDFLFLLGKTDENFFFLPKLNPENLCFSHLPLLEGYFANGSQKFEFLPQNQQENITSLMLHCWEGNKTAVEMLLEKGANPNIQSSISGQSATHFVVRSFQSEDLKIQLIELLLACSSPVYLTLQDKFDNSILHYAVKKQEPRLVSFLLSQDPNLIDCLNDESSDDSSHYDAFQLAIMTGNLEVIESFLKFFQTKNQIKIEKQLNYYLSRPRDSAIGSSELLQVFLLFVSGKVESSIVDCQNSEKQKSMVASILVNYFKSFLTSLSNVRQQKLEQWKRELNVIEKHIKQFSESSSDNFVKAKEKSPLVNSNQSSLLGKRPLFFDLSQEEQDFNFENKKIIKSTLLEDIPSDVHSAQSLQTSIWDIIVKWVSMKKIIKNTYQIWYALDEKSILFSDILSNWKPNLLTNFYDKILDERNLRCLGLQYLSRVGIIYDDFSSFEVIERFKSEIMREINADIDVLLVFQNIDLRVNNPEVIKSYYYFIYMWVVDQAKQSLLTTTEESCLFKLYEVTRILMFIDKRNIDFMMDILIKQINLDIESEDIYNYLFIDNTLNSIVHNVFADWESHKETEVDQDDLKQKSIRVNMQYLKDRFDAKEQLLIELSSQTLMNVALMSTHHS